MRKGAGDVAEAARYLSTSPPAQPFNGQQKLTSRSVSHLWTPPSGQGKTLGPS
jgi:hypothetical protein